MALLCNGLTHRWLDNKSFGEADACNKYDTPNPYSFHTIPLKTPTQRKAQAARKVRLLH